MQREKNQSKVIFYSTILLVVALCLIFALNVGDILNIRPPEFSKKNMLQALWYQYKDNYLEPVSLRSLDKQRDNITTSEGQSYTMLRSVWMDDKDTFDTVWQWSKDNLERKEDHLMSWLFGKDTNGAYRVLSDQGGYNTATDADSDMALSLLFASKRWGDQTYFGDAIVMIRDIWNKEVITINGKPYLLANNVEKTENKSTAIVNPSYFSPYAYKIFATVDPTHDWLGLASTSYDILNKSMGMNLDKSSTNLMPPDWIVIDKKTAAVEAPPAQTGLSTNWSYDAMRTPWRIALDYIWFGDERAKATLDRMSFLKTEWEKNNALAISYMHDGTVVSATQAPAIYGGAIGYFIVADPRDAQELYATKLEALYDTNRSSWARPQSYYDENWAWFGMALYANELKNLYAKT